MSNEIKVVENNQEKGISYRQYIARFNKAKKEGFLFECMWILYAMMEDRTTSFFDHIGFVSKQDKSKVTGTKKVKTQIKEILSVGDGKSVRIDFKSDAAPVIDVGASVEGSIIDILAQSILDNLSQYKKIYISIEGGPYYTGHIEFELDEVYLGR